jgi:hypothetical protein
MLERACCAYECQCERAASAGAGARNDAEAAAVLLKCALRVQRCAPDLCAERCAATAELLEQR